MNGLTLGSLFDGIGVFPLAASRCGIRPLWASEIEAAPISITQRHFPDMAHLGDITKLDGGAIPPVHVLTFGSPCQNLSQIGNRTGLAGAKSGLFFHAIRIIQEMRKATNDLYPVISIWENVMGAFSSNDRMDFRAVLSAFTDTEIPMPASGRWASAGMVRGGCPDLACVEPYFLPSFMQTETADYFNRNNKRYWHFCFPEEQIMPIPVFISLNVMYDLNVKSIRKGKDSRTHKSLTAHPGTPTMHMLQDSLLHFKNYVKKYPGKDILSMTLEDCMEIIMDHSLSENTGRFHTYLTESGKKKCRSRSLAVSGGYSRTLITFENGERKEERVDISVYRCRTCGHYHAVLPYHVIIPYVSYSVQFILSLFIDRKVRKMTVSALLRKYGLSRTTYYRLLKKLAPYYVIHRMTRDSYGMSLFVQAQADGRRLLDSVFTASCMALMEGSRTLHKQRPTSGTSPSLPE